MSGIKQPQSQTWTWMCLQYSRPLMQLHITCPGGKVKILEKYRELFISTSWFLSIQVKFRVARPDCKLHIVCDCFYSSAIVQIDARGRKTAEDNQTRIWSGNVNWRIDTEAREDDRWAMACAVDLPKDAGTDLEAVRMDYVATSGYGYVWVLKFSTWSMHRRGFI